MAQIERRKLSPCTLSENSGHPLHFSYTHLDLQTSGLREFGCDLSMYARKLRKEFLENSPPREMHLYKIVDGYSSNKFLERAQSLGFWYIDAVRRFSFTDT